MHDSQPPSFDQSLLHSIGQKAGLLHAAVHQASDEGRNLVDDAQPVELDPFDLGSPMRPLFSDSDEPSADQLRAVDLVLHPSAAADPGEISPTLPFFPVGSTDEQEVLRGLDEQAESIHAALCQAQADADAAEMKELEDSQRVNEDEGVHAPSCAYSSGSDESEA